MDPTRFDRITKLFAERRLNRRRAVQQGTAGLAAFGLAANGLTAAAAQDATPTAGTPPSAGSEVEVLYVQTFSSAMIQPDAEDPETFTMTLEGSTGQTVYFSDRPERLVGRLTDEQFLDSRAFDPADPPNAAIITGSGDAETILIVELTEPSYDATTTAVTYAAQVLRGQPEDDTLASLAARKTESGLGDSLGPVTLFIDQGACQPDNVACNQNSDCCSNDCQQLGEGPDTRICSD
jgi:hypothetical protein